MKTLEYSTGYRKALMDLHTALSKWEPGFRSGRRNNVKNVVSLLECILDNPDTFAAFVDETPICFRPKPDGNGLEYYITNEWPLSRKNKLPTAMERKEHKNGEKPDGIQCGRYPSLHNG